MSFSTTTKTTAKTARTTTEYKVSAFGYDFVIPAGSLVTNTTASGPDDNYRFWQDYGKQARELAGQHPTLLLHDLAHYGIIIPVEYCEPYPER